MIVLWMVLLQPHICIPLHHPQGPTSPQIHWHWWWGCIMEYVGNIAFMAASTADLAGRLIFWWIWWMFHPRIKDTSWQSQHITSSMETNEHHGHTWTIMWLMYSLMIYSFCGCFCMFQWRLYFYRSSCQSIGLLPFLLPLMRHTQAGYLPNRRRGREYLGRQLTVNNDVVTSKWANLWIEILYIYTCLHSYISYII
jgi:hypothetical protein